MDSSCTDTKIEELQRQLCAIRTERVKAELRLEALRREAHDNTEFNRAKIWRLLRKGHDAKLYNHAIQDLYTNEAQSMPNQYIIQRQAVLLSMLHKNDIYLHQIKVIQEFSNKMVNYLIVEASVLEKEQKVLEEELMMREGELMNQSFILEQDYHDMTKSQRVEIDRLKALVAPEEGTKFDEMSLDSCTVATIEESESHESLSTSDFSPAGKRREMLSSIGKLLSFSMSSTSLSARP